MANSGLVDIPGLGTVKVATIGNRLLARIIDSVLVGVVFWILYGIGVASLVSSTTKDAYGNTVPSGFGISVFFIVLLIGLVVSLLYEVTLIAIRGQTLGKQLLGVKVVRQENGQVPGWGPSFIRWIIPAVGAFVCYIGAILVYLSPLFDNSGRLQGWHDKAANDLVISTK